MLPLQPLKLAKCLGFSFFPPYHNSSMAPAVPRHQVAPHTSKVCQNLHSYKLLLVSYPIATTFVTVPCHLFPNFPTFPVAVEDTDFCFPAPILPSFDKSRTLLALGTKSSVLVYTGAQGWSSGPWQIQSIHSVPFTALRTLHQDGNGPAFLQFTLVKNF